MTDSLIRIRILFPYNLETVLMETNTYRTHWTFLETRKNNVRQVNNVWVGLSLLQVYLICDDVGEQ